MLKASGSAAVLLLMPGKLPASTSFARRRPGDALWPSKAAWKRLNSEVGGNLIPVTFPLDACKARSESAECAELFKNLRNPYYIGDTAGLTQTLGWTDAWTTKPSIYAVRARNAADIAAAVSFARENDLRLVVKGGGHSYLGTSNAPDSLLVWTRAMNEIEVLDSFVPSNCSTPPRRAVTLGSGTIWLHAYDAVTTQGGGYVQGGGCATVGCAGLIQSGGFGSFSKHYGSAASGLLEAEVVTADGSVRVANACTNPDLFWALKGGGGGTFGIISRLTLRVRELPEFFGGTAFTVKASSDAAYRRLLRRFVSFYAESLFNDHWGESVVFAPSNRLRVSMVSYGLSQDGARAAWKPFLDFVASSPRDYTQEFDPIILCGPARHWWDADFLHKFVPGAIVLDPRPGAHAGDFWWSGDGGQAGQVLHGYESLWLPASLLRADAQAQLADAFFTASRPWGFALHFNKGLAGAQPDAIAAALDTATNPAVTTAFALAISAGEEPPAYPGIPGHEPDVAAGRAASAAIHRGMNVLRTLTPDDGSYVSESNFFQDNWQRSYWGSNYSRLAAIKKRYDPTGLFVVHNGVGSEEWSADGFSRA
ncbi:MAG: FAD-binding protein [Candidatus Cybelea sp.]|jgi:FAD/FMN-containing dehydrogenase